MKPRAPNATPSAESLGGATPTAPETPDNAWRFADEFANIDVTSLAPELTVPTLIMCSDREPDNRCEQSRLLAALIPKSRLVPLDSSNHLLPERDPAWR